MNFNPAKEKAILVERNLNRQQKERERAEEKFKKTYGISDAVYKQCLKQEKNHTLLT